MEAKHITDAISVSPQISVADLGAIKEAGFRAIICNRPDGEGVDQPPFAVIEAEARKLGLEMHYQPVISGGLQDEDVTNFAALLDSLPEPVFVYCRSGTRSAMLWALSQLDKQPLSEILERTTAAGYDLAGVIGRVSEHR